MLDLDFSVSEVYRNKIFGKIKNNIYYNFRGLRKTPKAENSLYHVGLNFNREARDILNPQYNYVFSQGFGNNENRRRNRVIEKSLVFKKAGNQCLVNDSNVEVTNITSANGKPLFFRHEIPKDVNSESVKILNEEKQLYETSLDFKIIKEGDATSPSQEVLRKVVCHSFENKKAKRFVTYELNGVQYKEILNTSSLFQRNRLKPIVYNYSLDEENKILRFSLREESDGFVLLMPEDENVFFLREREGGGSYYCKLNLNTFSSEPWFPTIQNLEFKDREVKYKIMEWMNEVYSLAEFTRKTRRDFGKIINDRTLQVSKKSIIKKDENYSEFLELVFFDDTYSIKRIVTNNPQKKNVYSSQYNLFWDIDESISVDSGNGFIYSPNGDFKKYEKFYANYIYDSIDSYEIRDLNINPFVDKTLVGKKIVYYITPWSKSQQKNIFYIIMNEDEVVEAISQDGSFGEEDLSSLIGSSYREKNESSLNQNGALGLSISIGDFYAIDELRSRDYIILGIFSIPENLKEVDGSLITKTGGFEHSSFFEIKNKNPLSLRFLEGAQGDDSFPVRHLENAVIAKIPWVKCKDFVDGELFSKQELKKLLFKNLPASKRARIQWSLCPLLKINKEDIDWENETVKFRWSRVSKWKDKNINGKFYKSTDGENFSLVEDLGSLNQITEKEIDFSVDKLFYVKIIPEFEGFEGPSSNIIKVKLES